MPVEPSGNPETPPAGTPPEGGTPPAGTPPAATPPAAPEVPAEYKFTAPEGVKFDDKILAEFTGVAKDLKLPQEGADKVVAVAVKMQQARDAAVKQAVEAQQQEWQAKSKADPEFGGDKLNESLGHAKRFIDAYGSPEFVQVLNQFGLGDHPAVIRALVKAGKELKQDQTVPGGVKPAATVGTLNYDKSNHV